MLLPRTEFLDWILDHRIVFDFRLDLFDVIEKSELNAGYAE
jgi:hypothetical protein